MAALQMIFEKKYIIAPNNIKKQMIIAPNNIIFCIFAK
jgi:hypothetical protein